MTFVPAAFHAHDDQRRAGATRFVAPGGSTGGEFGLFRSEIPAGGAGAVPHFHRRFSESFYLLDGELTVRYDDTERTVAAGDFLYVPRETLHAFHTGPERSATLLMIFVPGARREEYFEEMAELFAREPAPTAEQVDAVAARHDQINVRP